MLFKHQPYDFEDLYRPIFEFYITTIWLGAGVCLSFFDFITGVPLSISRLQIGLCVFMAIIFLFKGKNLYFAQKKLFGSKQEFISLKDFTKKTQKFVKQNTVWLGTGFNWTPTQTQRYHEIIKHEFATIGDHLPLFANIGWRFKNAKKALTVNSSNVIVRFLGFLLKLPYGLFKFIFPEKYKSTHMGQKWIHGLSDTEEPIAIPLEYFKGHALILGTTGSGKTRLAELLNAQAIMRGECLIIIDPKGDKELKENAKRACDAYREYCKENNLPDLGERFYSFHPAFPDESVRLNLLANIARDTDVASRIANLTPSKDGGMDPFVAFGWLAINTIAQAQLLLEENPSLESIKKDLLDSMQSLTDRAIEKFCLYTDNEHAKLGDDWQFDYKSMYNRAKTEAIEKGSINLLERRFIFNKGSAEAIPAEALTIIKCWIFKNYENEKNASTISSLVKLYQHPKDHFAKMINNMLPILEMLSTGTLSSMLSIDNTGSKSVTSSEQISTLDIIQKRGVLYVGLDSLSDGVVGGAIGSLLLSDLTAAAGRIYNFMGDTTPPINVFVDEAAECLNEPCIRLLNKGRGAKFRLIVATQTIPDFASRLGSKEKASMVLGNVNNKIALRTEDETSQEYLCKDLPNTVIREMTHSQGQNSLITNPLEHGSTQSEQLKETQSPLVEQQMFGQLPNCEYIANFAGGKVIKGRLPIIGEDYNKIKKVKKVRKSEVKPKENDLDLNDGLRVE